MGTISAVYLFQPTLLVLGLIFTYRSLFGGPPVDTYWSISGSSLTSTQHIASGCYLLDSGVLQFICLVSPLYVFTQLYLTKRGSDLHLALVSKSWT